MSPGQMQPPSTPGGSVQNHAPQDEEAVDQYYPAANPSAGANKAVLGLLIFLGFPLLFFFGFGLLLWLVAIAYYFAGRRSRNSLGPVKYVLTTKRVWTEDVRNTSSPVVVEQANLVDVSPAVQNKLNTKYHERNQSSGYEISGFVGDVLFFDDRTHVPRVRFLHVPDPDGIKETVNSIKKSYMSA
jgi:hypothetical protein